MDNNLLIAKILGVYMLASGLVMLFRGKTLALVLKDLFDHRALTWVAGLVLIVLGGFMAFAENVFTGAGSEWVRVFGWIVLAKGFLYIVYPEFLEKAAKVSKGLSAVWGIIAIALALWLFML